MRKRTHPHLSEETLERFVDRDLTGREADAVRRHLVSCADCRTRLTACEALFARMAALPRFAPAPGFPDRVMARIAAARATEFAAARAAWSPIAQWVRRLWPLAAGVAVFWTASVGGALAWITRQSEGGLAGWISWTLARLQDAFWTGVVRVAGAVNFGGLDLNVSGLVLFVAFLTLVALWGARVLVRYATPMSKVRTYA